MARYSLCRWTDGGVLSEIKQVRDGLKRVVDLVRDRARKAADNSELLGLNEGLLGEAVLGNVDAEHDDAGDRAVGVAPRLVDEVEVTQLKRLRGAASELDGRAASDVRLTGAIDGCRADR